MRLLLIAILVPRTACSKSPTAPSPGEPSGRLEGQAVSALDGSAVPGASVRIGGRSAVTTDASGRFEVDIDTPGTYAAVVRGGAFVERETMVTGPGAAPARLSLIPASFDLVSFDEMFRASHARLQRWTSPPRLVILGAVMEYRGASADGYTASSEQLSETEIALMREHLTEGLAALTGGSFTGFASVDVERPAAGQRVQVARADHIVVGRYNGIVTFARTIGYGSWAEAEDGTITGGAMFLDRDFDKEDGRRRLLRIHELGHALGYQHVESRRSIMNPSLGSEPTDDDRSGARIAFQRPPGNRAPDADPGSSTRTFAVTGGAPRWATVYCR